MKKAIAILLILVIGMVGVFAGENGPSSPSTLIFLETNVAEYSRMAITKSSTSPQWTALDEASSVYGTAQTAYTFGGETVYFHAESNSRAGIKISMQAQPLTSTIGEDSTAIEAYLDYEVTIGNSTSITAKSLTSDGVASGPVEVANLKYNTVSRKPASYSDPVSINITDNLADAAAGNYTGQIAFWIATN